MPEEPMGHQETLVQLMTEHQGRLYAYILSLLGNPDQANDVLQDTNVVLWRSIGEFRVGSNFKAWAFRIAHFQVMACRQRQIRERLFFDDDLLSTLSLAAREMDETPCVNIP
jgi:RNA polymerase sigma-70 factor (ECF subfamily)